ncbi:MAG: DUF4097 family beta strand repeat-containing protein [Treponema sp.]|uniref:DUF4097 family beta strand repeat-containing protein n=1 Tax=Treponema sp. TaxID=166 RepID=UPI003FA1D72E
MKSSTKKILIWALILMGIGTVLMAAALAGGAHFQDLNCDIIGNRHFRHKVFNGIYNLNAMLSDDDWDEDLDDMYETDEDLREAYAELKSLPLSFTDDYKGKTVRSIEIDLSAVLIDIEQGETLAVSVRQGRRRSVYGSLKNGVLEIEEKGGYTWKRNRKNNTAYVVLTLPENTRLDELDISLNAGALSLNHRSLTVNELSVELNAGAVSIRNITSSHTDIDCNAGSVRIDGRLRGQTDADCNAGKIDLTVDSGGEDYSWDTQAALGSIRVNDSVSSGLTNRGRSGGKKANHLDLSAAVGSIDVSIR